MEQVQLGLRENWQQFVLLVIINAFVGGMVGLERTILPEIAEGFSQPAKLEQDMQKAQEELANMEVTGQAGGGMVTVVMTGRHDVKRVSIDDSLMGDDKEMLEDLLAAAVNDAVRQVDDQVPFAQVQEAVDGLAQAPPRQPPQFAAI